MHNNFKIKIKRRKKREIYVSKPKSGKPRRAAETPKPETKQALKPVLAQMAAEKASWIPGINTDPSSAIRRCIVVFPTASREPIFVFNNRI